MSSDVETSLFDEFTRINNELAAMQRETFKRNIELSRLATIVASSEDAIISTDMEGVFISWNASAERLYGIKKAEALGRNAAALSLPGLSDLAPAGFERLRNGKPFEPRDSVYRSKDGANRYVSQSFSPFLDSLGNLAGVSCSGRDITARKNAEDALSDVNAELEKANLLLESLATRDGLTGLRNHRVFQETLEVEVERAQRYNLPLALVMLDVDHFKDFNDTYGHPAGDAVLAQVAALLQNGVREVDLAARYGGEEFVLILTQTGSEAALLVAERIRTSIASATWASREITVSIGVCALSMGAADCTTLIECADRALYRSKREGRNRVTYGGTAGMATASTIVSS